MWDPTLARARRRRTDRCAYRNARSLTDLGELTAQYLTGARSSHPCSSVVDPRTRTIIDDLTRLNAAGLPTLGSRPGDWCTTHDGLLGAFAVAERTAVTLLVPARLDDRIAAHVAARGLLVSSVAVTRVSEAAACVPVAISTRHPVRDTPDAVDDPDPDGGVRWSVHDVLGGPGRGRLDRLCGALGGDARAAVVAASALTVIDPQWGPRRTVWDVLDDAVTEVGGRAGRHRSR